MSTLLVRQEINFFLLLIFIADRIKGILELH
jgi:hypothetical protein